MKRVHGKHIGFAAEIRDSVTADIRPKNAAQRQSQQQHCQNKKFKKKACAAGHQYFFYYPLVIKFQITKSIFLFGIPPASDL